LNAAVEAAVNASLKSGNTAGRKINSEVVTAAVNAAIAASKEVNVKTAQAEVIAPANTTEVQTLAFSAPEPYVPLPNTEETKPANTETIVSEPVGLEEGDYESLSPSVRESSSSRNTESSQQGGGIHSSSRPGSINVQTSSQPILVVPLNVSNQRGGVAQYMNSAAPGAPPTIAVDTSIVSNTPPSRASSPSGPRNNSQKVTVTKSGGGVAGASSPSANTRVTVVKHN